MKRLLAGLCAASLMTGSAAAVVSEMTPPPEEVQTCLLYTSDAADAL